MAELNDYISIIQQRRSEKGQVKIDFSKIPEEFHEPIIKELSSGYDQTIESAIRDKKDFQNHVTVKYFELPEPQQMQKAGDMSSMFEKAKGMIKNMAPMARQALGTTNRVMSAVSPFSSDKARMVAPVVLAGTVKASEVARDIITDIPEGIPKAAAYFKRGLNPASPISEEDEYNSIGESIVPIIAETAGMAPAFIAAEMGGVTSLEAMFANRMAKMTPLANNIIKQATAGSLFSVFQKGQAEGPGALITKPVETAEEAAQSGVLFGAFPVLGKLASGIIKRFKGNPVGLQEMTKATVTEIERLQYSAATHINPEQYGAGNVPVPNTTIIEDLNHVISLVKEKKLGMPKEITEETEYILDYNQSLYHTYKDLVDTAISKGIKIDDLVYKAERSQYIVKFKPERAFEEAGEGVKLGHAFNEDILSTLEPNSRIIKAGATANESSPELVDTIIKDYYDKGLPNAISGNGVKKLLADIEAIKTDPKAWRQALVSYADMYGYDAINFGEAGVQVFNGNALFPNLGANVKKKIREVVPDIIPDDALNMMPMIKGTIKDMPSISNIKTKVWQLKKQKPNMVPEELNKEIKDWVRKQASKEPNSLVDLSVAKVGKNLIASGKDIGMIMANFVDHTHIYDTIDPSGTLLRRISYPLKLAETDGEFWAKKVKDNFNKATGNIEAGSKESALLQKIGEQKEWLAAQTSKIEKMMKSRDIKGASEARVQLERDKEEIKKASTPERLKLLHGIRKTYDYLIDDVLNPIRIANGKKPIAKREDYFMHFQELSLMDEIFGGMGEIPDDMIEKYFIKDNEPFFSAEMHRHGLRWKEDAVGGFHRYIEGISKVIFLTPEAAKINASAEYLPPQLRAYTTNMVKYALGKPPAASPGSFDATFKAISESFVGRMLRKGQKNIISNSIVGSWGTALAQLNIVPILIGQTGMRDVLWAITDVYGPGAHLRRASSRSLSPSVASHTFSTFDLEHSSANSIKHMVNLPVEQADNEMSQLAFWAGIHNAKRLGKKGSDIIAHADKIASFVNATYTRSSTPAFLRSDVAKFVFPLQRQMFNASATTALLLGKGPWKKRLKSAAQIEASGVGMNMALGGIMSALGIEEHREIFQPTDLIPFYNYFAYGGQIMVLKTAKDTFKGAGNIARGKKGGMKNVGKGMTMLTLPYGGRQILNMLEGRPFGKELKKKK